MTGFGKLGLLLMVIVGMVLAAASATAETWDAASGFSQANNPSGVWTYGYQTAIDGALTKFNSVTTPIAGIASWCKNNSVDLAGNVDKNISGAAVDTSGIRFEIGQLCFHPGPTGERAVVRWMAPSAMTIAINARFTGQDYGAGSTCDVHVLKNNVAIYNGTINGFAGGGSHASFGPSPVQSFSTFLTVAAGETMDFVAGDGGNGFGSDLVGLSVTITTDALVTKTTIAEVKSLADGTPVSLTSPKVVTAASTTFFDGGYYIEEPTRICGIKVIPPSSTPAVVPGSRVTLTGMLGMDSNGERVLRVGSIDSVSAGTELAPLGMSCDSALAEVGMDTCGLLVKTWGLVTCVAPDGSCLYVNDGSRAPPGQKSGIMVVLSGLTSSVTRDAQVGEYVSVVGLRGRAMDGSISVPAVYLRGGSDITWLKTLPVPTATQLAQTWIDNNLAPGSPTQPFVFYYEGYGWSSYLLPNWPSTFSTEQLDANRLQRTITYSAPDGKLQIRCVAIQYSDYPAVEWTIYFKNIGTANTPILHSVRAMSTNLADASPSGDYYVYHAQGCNAQLSDFQPFVAGMNIGSQVNLKSVNGKSSEGILPFFNIQMPGGDGVAMAIGWTGQWQASFTRDSKNNLNVQSGMIISENLWDWTHTYLMPGEEIRTPSTLLIWWTGGDRMVGQNQLRKLILAHYTGVPNPPVCTAWPGSFDNRTATTEMACMAALADDGPAYTGDTNYHAYAPVDTYVIDTGWFPVASGQMWEFNTGTWYPPDPVRFPAETVPPYRNGMKLVSDYAHSLGYKLGLWFEPERAMAGTDAYVTLSTIPPYTSNALLVPSSTPGGVDLPTTRLVNFGDPQALAWIKGKISSCIGDYGVDMYRQDMNIRPMLYWRTNESSSRAAMTQIKYIMGLYDFLDYLRAQHPNLIIDNCAGGGKRIDIEMLKRSFMLTRTDGDIWNVNGAQSQTYGLAQWIPITGMGGDYTPYNFRSGWGSHYYIPIAWQDIPNSNAAWNTISGNLSYLANYKYLFRGDFYPCSETPYSTASNVWMAWQFDKSDLGDGILQAFRRTDCTGPTAMTLRLKGLNPASSYLLTNPDNVSYFKTMTGSQLMDSGISVTLSPSGAAIIRYRRLN